MKASIHVFLHTSAASSEPRKQFGVRHNRAICCCGWIFRVHFGLSRGLVLYKVRYLKSQARACLMLSSTVADNYDSDVIVEQALSITSTMWDINDSGTTSGIRLELAVACADCVATGLRILNSLKPGTI